MDRAMVQEHLAAIILALGDGERGACDLDDASADVDANGRSRSGSTSTRTFPL